MVATAPQTREPKHLSRLDRRQIFMRLEPHVSAALDVLIEDRTQRRGSSNAADVIREIILSEARKVRKARESA